MKQLILKELRERYSAALLGMALFSVLLFMAYSSYSGDINRTAWSSGYMGANAFQPMMKTELLVQSCFFCGLFGGLLGWLQIRAEKHPDLWAFLVHRPTERSLLFWGKVIAGLLLYSLATAIPIGVFCLWCSLPGKVAAPFEWSMALPLLTVMLTGIGYYFAGALTALRKARWYASRGVGLGLALIPSLTLFGVPEFWQGLLLLTVCAGALGLAARGSFLSGGTYEGQSILSKIALTLTTITSMILGIAFLFGLAVNALSTRDTVLRFGYQILKDGQVLQIAWRQYADPIIHDLAGKDVLDPSTGKKLKHADLGKYTADTLAAAVPRNHGKGIIPSDDRSYWDRYYSPARFFSPWRVHDKTIWYLTAGGKLIGYSAQTRLQTGTLQPGGTPKDGAPDDSRFQLPNHYAWGSYYGRRQSGVLCSARSTYRVDLENGELLPVLQANDGDPFLAVSDGGPSIAGVESTEVLVLTASSIRLLRGTGESVISLPYSPSYLQFPSVTVAWLAATNTFAVRIEPDYASNEAAGGTLAGRILWLGSNGKVRETTELPLSAVPHTIEPIARITFSFIPLAVPEWSMAKTKESWLPPRIAMSLVIALAGLWIARRGQVSAKAQVAWFLCILLVGLPALLAFVALQEFPPREACPGCKGMRSVDREICAHCNAPFEAPAKNGTEIFASLTPG